jgi:hypothetical protein
MPPPDDEEVPRSGRAPSINRTASTAKPAKRFQLPSPTGQRGKGLGNQNGDARRVRLIPRGDTRQVPGVNV